MKKGAGGRRSEEERRRVERVDRRGRGRGSQDFAIDKEGKDGGVRRMRSMLVSSAKRVKIVNLTVRVNVGSAARMKKSEEGSVSVRR